MPRKNCWATTRTRAHFNPNFLCNCVTSPSGRGRAEGEGEGGARVDPYMLSARLPRNFRLSRFEPVDVHCAAQDCSHEEAVRGGNQTGQTPSFSPVGEKVPGGRMRGHLLRLWVNSVVSQSHEGTERPRATPKLVLSHRLKQPAPVGRWNLAEQARNQDVAKRRVNDEPALSCLFVFFCGSTDSAQIPPPTHARDTAERLLGRSLALPFWNRRLSYCVLSLRWHSTQQNGQHTPPARHKQQRNGIAIRLAVVR